MYTNPGQGNGHNRNPSIIKFADELQKEGLSKEVANIIAERFGYVESNGVANPASKQDVESSKAELKKDIEMVRVDLKKDIEMVRVELKLDIEMVRKEMELVKVELEQKIEGVKAELKQEIAEVKSELKQDIAEVKAELKQDIATIRQNISNLKLEIVDIIGRRITISTGCIGLLMTVFHFIK